MNDKFNKTYINKKNISVKQRINDLFSSTERLKEYVDSSVEELAHFVYCDINNCIRSIKELSKRVDELDIRINGYGR